MNAEQKYEQYLTLHRDFSETYTKVYKHVMDFYPLPKKFIHDATPEIDHYVESFWALKNSPTESSSFRDLVFFAKNFKEFSNTANHVFEEYKGLHSQSGNYIKTVFRLKEKNADDREEYSKLIPVLSELISGFETIKQKTDNAACQLLRLQIEWSGIKEKIMVPKAVVQIYATGEPKTN